MSWIANVIRRKVTPPKGNEFELTPTVPSGDNLVSELAEDRTYSQIIETGYFQRLFHISFLGGLSYLEDSGRDNTRGHHSVGAALLAYYYCKLCKADKKTERLLVVSALLHDIHHLPFSHTMERAIKSRWGDFSFGYLTKEIIFSRSRAGEQSICDILAAGKVDWRELPILKAKAKRAPVFSSTHNVDTLDGITRAYVLLFMNDPKVSELGGRVVRVLANRNSLASDKTSHWLDAFWELKDKVYAKGIYEPKRVLLERILGYYLLDLCREFAYPDDLVNYTDKDLLERFPELDSKIKSLWKLISTHCAVSYSNSNGESDSTSIFCPTDTKFPNQNKAFEFKIPIRRFKINKSAGLEAGESSWKKRFTIVPDSIRLTITRDVMTHIEDILEYPMLRERVNLIFAEPHEIRSSRVSSARDQ